MLLSPTQTTGGFLNLVLALVLPLAYGFQPDLVLLFLGTAHSLRESQAALLAALLQVPAGGRVLALLVEVRWAGGRAVGWQTGRQACHRFTLPLAQESVAQLAGVLAQVLHGEAPPSLGPFCMASPGDKQALMHLRRQLESQWKMLQVAGETRECPGPRGTTLFQSSVRTGAAS